MEVTYGADKNVVNIHNHGVALESAKGMDFTTAYYQVDDSQDYGEVRIIAIGFIGSNLYVLVFTDTAIEDTVRAISLRRAERHEERNYDENN